MFKKRIIIFSIISVLIVISCSLIYILGLYENGKNNGPILYDYKSSYHDEFYVENNYVVFVTSVKLRNTSAKDLFFYMNADVSEDNGLVVEDTAIACEKASNKKLKFYIKAKSDGDFKVYFKAKKGTKSTKKNRLPPSNITFEII